MQTAVRPHPLPSLLQAEQAQVSLSLLVHHMAPAPQQPGGPDHRGWAASLQPFLCQQGQHWTWHSRCGPTSAEESEGSPRPACWLTACYLALYAPAFAAPCWLRLSWGPQARLCRAAFYASGVQPLLMHRAVPSPCRTWHLSLAELDLQAHV